MGKFKVGDRVKVKKSVEVPECGWGAVDHSCVGTIREIGEKYSIIDFPEQRGWNGILSEMEKINITLENK